ncbi:coiled-coil domain-containing protein 150 isoform X2 [Narcine bancroftii]|uniref:coiled-coil domain-containing protein 150 isoform X2 n=1 Tax=Narcine bancroftii TaxID=1343680 RepID=UPI0038314EB3
METGSQEPKLVVFPPPNRKTLPPSEISLSLRSLGQLETPEICTGHQMITTDASSMSYAPIPPMHIGATVPETFAVLHHRIIAAEEQTDALIQEVESLGICIEDSGTPKIGGDDSWRPVSPLNTRRAFGVENDVLWKNYELLVSRVCRLESVIQTMKLNLFRIQTAKELTPEFSVDQLAEMQEEHDQEVNKIQREMMHFRQQLNEVSEEKEAAQEEIERLSAALEITTTTKIKIAMTAEELKATNTKMGQKLQEMMNELAQEVDLRKALEESHVHLLQRVQELDKVVEVERKQVKELQQDSLALRKDEHLTQEISQEQQKISDLEKMQNQLQIESDVKESIISELADEGKNQQEENANLQSEITLLKDMVEKLQCEQEDVKENLHEQELLLDAAKASISAELQSAVNEKQQLKKELEALRLEYMEVQQKFEIMEKKTMTQKMLLESEIAHQKEKLTSSVNEYEQLKQEKETQMDQANIKIDNLTKENNRLEIQVTENQSRVEQLQDELQHRYDASSENVQLQKAITLLETKYSQVQLVLEQREKDFALSIISCDEALREKQMLKEYIEMMEEKENQEIANFQQHLIDSKQSNSQMAATLENVLMSHSKLQQMVQKLQIELGQRIMQIHSLQEEKTHVQIILQKLHAELEDLQGKLTIMEAQYSIQEVPLHKGPEVARHDDQKVAPTLEQTLQASNNLQIQLNRLQDKLDKENQQHQLVHNREQEVMNAKMESKMFNERIETLKKQFQSERELVKKASQKEIIELKKTLHETTSKSAELSRTNRELRLKVTEFEKIVKCLKTKIKDQKAQLKNHLEAKNIAVQNKERIKEFEADLKQMETIKEKYQKKNIEQSQMILKFRREVQILQEELKNVAKSQNEAVSLCRQEIQLKKENQLILELRSKCQGLEEKIRNLQNCKEETELKLKEASLESQQISADLEEAHQWFKSKFFSLQAELIKVRGIDTSKEQLYSGENQMKTGGELGLSSKHI